MKRQAEQMQAFTKVQRYKGPSMIIKARQKALPGDVVILQPVTLILLAKETREGRQRPKIPGVLVLDGVVATVVVRTYLKLNFCFGLVLTAVCSQE